jgi:hypothetical protein
MLHIDYVTFLILIGYILLNYVIIVFMISFNYKYVILLYNFYQGIRATM